MSATTPAAPWVGTLVGPAEMTGDQMVAAMGEVGVDGRDPRLAVFDVWLRRELRASTCVPSIPGNSGLVKPVDPSDPRRCRDDRRLGGDGGHSRHPHHDARQLSRPIPADPGLNPRAFAAARAALDADQSLVLGDAWSRPDNWRRATRTPSSSSTIFGLQQPFEPPPPAEPWAELPKVLTPRGLSQYRDQDQRRPARCLTRSFPYQDIWDPLARIFGRVFGFRALPVGARIGRAPSNC